VLLFFFFLFFFFFFELRVFYLSKEAQGCANLASMGLTCPLLSPQDLWRAHV
jgi:hypothetical protein